MADVLSSSPKMNAENNARTGTDNCCVDPQRTEKIRSKM
jgi:hypothetical protein